MNYKITKDVPIVSDRKKEAYRYRMNFYTKNFKERKFCFWRDPISKKYTVQRTA